MSPVSIDVTIVYAFPPCQYRHDCRNLRSFWRLILLQMEVPYVRQ
jgi:hypothetical protein